MQHEIVRTVEALALESFGEMRLDARLQIDERDGAVALICHQQAATGCNHAVGTRLLEIGRPAFLVRSLIAGGRLPDFAASLLRPFDDSVRPGIRAEQVAVLAADPHRTFDPDKSVADLLHRCLDINEIGQRRIELRDRSDIRVGRTHRERGRNLRARQRRAHRHWRRARRWTGRGLGQDGAGDRRDPRRQHCAPGKSALHGVHSGLSIRACFMKSGAPMMANVAVMNAN